MREIKDGKFAKMKARHWNKDFYRKAGAMRRDMAAVLNQYCSNRNIDYRADHRSNAERGPPAAEPRLPRWNFHHYKRTGKKTSALEGRDRERAARG
jgi:MobA/MobL family